MKRRGFSLLEVLVALMLVGILVSGVGMALRTGLDASDRIRQRSDVHAEARGALDLLAADLGAAFLSGANTEETLFSAEPAADAGDAPFLRFTTLSYRRSSAEAAARQESRSDAVRVDYSLVRTPAGLATLVRRERWLTENGPGEVTEVCAGVVGLQLLYFDGGEPQEDWGADAEASPPIRVKEGEEVPGASSRTLPRAVEVTLLLSPAGSRAEDKQRAYKTTILLSANGVAPFETEVTPAPQPGAPEGGNPGPGGQPGG
jgi:general secretion pathway protein J